MKRTAFSTAILLGLAACGGGESADTAETAAPDAPAAEAAAPAATTMPDWYQMTGSDVTLDITAGSTPTGNYWNFNGAQNGAMTITVPVGSNVTINFTNSDPSMAHSLGIAANFTSPPAMIDATPIFAGAITTGADNMAAATQTNGTESITFVADAAGEYTMVCLVPGHAVSGMWIRFVVSDTDEAGVIGAM